MIVLMPLWEQAWSQEWPKLLPQILPRTNWPGNIDPGGVYPPQVQWQFGEWLAIHLMAASMRPTIFDHFCGLPLLHRNNVRQYQNILNCTFEGALVDSYIHFYIRSNEDDEKGASKHRIFCSIIEPSVNHTQE